MPDPQIPAGFVIVARLVRPRGLKGELFAAAESWTPAQLRSFPNLTLQPSGQVVELENAWSHQDRVILKLRGIDTIEQAEPLRDALLCIPKQDRPPVPAGEYYFSDLIGCRVIRMDTGIELGVVKDCLEYGGPMLLEVRQGEREMLIPFVSAICPRVDVDGKTIHVDLPEGLDEL